MVKLPVCDGTLVRKLLFEIRAVVGEAVVKEAADVFEHDGPRLAFADKTKRGREQVALVIRAEDNGPGIKDIDLILSGAYQSSSGLGLGLLGCKRLLNEFSIDTGPGRGTRVVGKMVARGL